MRKTRVAELNRGWTEKTEAWIHYQKSNQTRRQEKLGASQDKSNLSHSNDWCAKTGSNTTPPKETDASKAQNPSLAGRKASQKALWEESTEKEHQKTEDPGRRAAVYDLLPNVKKKRATLHRQTGRETRRGGEGWGPFIYQFSVRFNLVVGSLLSPPDLCNSPSSGWLDFCIDNPL